LLSSTSRASGCQRPNASDAWDEVVLTCGFFTTHSAFKPCDGPGRSNKVCDCRFPSRCSVPEPDPDPERELRVARVLRPWARRR
jgi:hypothetical protein